MGKTSSSFTCHPIRLQLGHDVSILDKKEWGCRLFYTALLQKCFQVNWQTLYISNKYTAENNHAIDSGQLPLLMNDRNTAKDLSFRIQNQYLKEAFETWIYSGKICASIYQNSFLRLWKNSYLQKKDKLFIWYLVLSCMILISTQYFLGGFSSGILNSSAHYHHWSKILAGGVIPCNIFCQLQEVQTELQLSLHHLRANSFSDFG